MNETPDEPVDDEAGLASHPLTAARLAKHQGHVAAGGYPYRFERTATSAELHQRHAGLEPATDTGEQVVVAGRVLGLRRLGRLTFAVLADPGGTIQLFVSRAVLGEEAFATFDELDVGDWIGASGEVVTTKTGELSVKVEGFDLLAKSLRPLPEKWHGLTDTEARSRQRYLDLMVNEESRRTAVTRARIVAELRHQFEDRGYIEVETPVLLAEATGALARPFETHHHALGMDMRLRIATELYLKRLVVGGLERVFEIGRIFRNEGIDATHNPEFTMLESYQALADYNDVAVMVEEILSAVAVAATGAAQVEYQGRTVDLSPPYRRARMVDLVAEVAGERIDFDADVEQARAVARRLSVEPDPAWRHGRIVDAIFEAHVADDLWEPTYVLDHPVEVSPLARRHRTDPHLTERFELFIAGSEYANAFSELNDPLDQRDRFEAQAAARLAGDEEAHPVDEDYIRALEYGLPPTGGLGIGVDRLVMLLTGHTHIRDVLLFPTMRPK